jgi:hypothetical protein
VLVNSGGLTCTQEWLHEHAARACCGCDCRKRACYYIVADQVTAGSFITKRPLPSATHMRARAHVSAASSTTAGPHAPPGSRAPASAAPLSKRSAGQPPRQVHTATKHLLGQPWPRRPCPAAPAAPPHTGRSVSSSNLLLLHRKWLPALREVRIIWVHLGASICRVPRHRISACLSGNALLSTPTARAAS